MNAYDLYKPLRNHLRRFSRLDALGVVRAHLQHLQFGQRFPQDIEVDLAYLRSPSRVQKHVYEWELEILAKEIILNCPDTGEASLKKWSEFSRAINKLKELENSISGRYRELFKSNILIELYRIAHRQFPWQKRPNRQTLVRYFKIFGHPHVDTILQRRIGLTAQQLYTLGLLFAGFYLDKFGLTTPIKLEFGALAPDHLARFVSRFSIEFDDLKQRITANQCYDHDFAYIFNPLKLHPLVWVDLRGQRTLIAPVPTYLFRRFTEGVYYEICDDPEFARGFGSSFQDYVGEVAGAANQRERFTILDEKPYSIGKDRKDSVDWIVSDATAHIFLECKTKKLRYAAKIGLAATDVLDEDLDKMAGFMVQMYKTLIDGKDNRYSHWSPDGKEIFPVIVTLEDWYAFGDRIVAELDTKVRQKFVGLNMEESLLQQHPYTICSVDELEDAIRVMEVVGIAPVMAAKTQGERRLWALGPVLGDQFRRELSQVERTALFPGVLESIALPR